MSVGAAPPSLITGSIGNSCFPAFTYPPLASTFTSTNVGSSTLVNNGNLLVFQTPANASIDSTHVWTKTAPATPWTLTALLCFDFVIYTASAIPFIGLVTRESSTGKIIALDFESSVTAGTFGFDIMQWTNATTFTSRAATSASRHYSPFIYFRIQDTGVNLVFSWSYNGITFHTMHTMARNSFFTTGPNEIGLGGHVYETNSASLTVLSWELT